MLFLKKFYPYLLLYFLNSCSNFGQLHLVSNLPYELEEVSGTQRVINSDLIWMLNDSGNPDIIYAISKKGELQGELLINAENHDWEDLTTDNNGNLYIGDFGNNHNTRKDLVILKIKNEDLVENMNNEVERIQFYYPNQLKFPPNKKQLYFDTEAFFFYKDSIYLFTKSRVKGDYGYTSLYKIPAIAGNHAAQFISDFTFCTESKCSITSAAISLDKNKVVLLSHDTVILLTDFTDDDFFSGKVTQLPLHHNSQKEGICFKDNNTLYITDERNHGQGGNLYEFKF